MLSYALNITWDFLDLESLLASSQYLTSPHTTYQDLSRTAEAVAVSQQPDLTPHTTYQDLSRTAVSCTTMFVANDIYDPISLHWYTTRKWHRYINIREDHQNTYYLTAKDDPIIAQVDIEFRAIFNFCSLLHSWTLTFPPFPRSGHFNACVDI